MKDAGAENAIALLSRGVKILRENDAEVERLLAPRHDEALSLLERYIKEIELFNSAYSLVGVSDTKELVIKHILDSLSPLGIISRLLTAKNGTSIADAGSGAGLPGIPLAIALPEREFTLIERMGRRAGFLFNTQAILASFAKGGLNNISVEEGDIAETGAGRFSLITFRAFKEMNPDLIKTLFNALAARGVIACYKGRLEKIKMEMAPLEKSGCQWEAVPYNVPFLDAERHLLVIGRK